MNKSVSADIKTIPQARTGEFTASPFSCSCEFYVGEIWSCRETGDCLFHCQCPKCVDTRVEIDKRHKERQKLKTESIISLARYCLKNKDFNEIKKQKRKEFFSGQKGLFSEAIADNIHLLKECDDKGDKIKHVIYFEGKKQFTTKTKWAYEMDAKREAIATAQEKERQARIKKLADENFNCKQCRGVYRLYDARQYWVGFDFEKTGICKFCQIKNKEIKK